MKHHLCALFYILGCILLVAAYAPAPVQMQTYSIAIPPLKPEFAPLQASLKHSPEVICLAEAIYHEGRGEPTKTQIMIAEVTVNRVKDDSGMFPYTICGVVHQRREKNTCQYSWFCEEHPIANHVAWDRSKTLAHWLYKHYYQRRDVPDLTKGSLYFTTIETHRNWMKSMDKMVQSGNMKFLADN